MVAGLDKTETQNLSEDTQEESQEKLQEKSQEEEDWDDFMPDDDEPEQEKVVYQDKDADLDIPEDPYTVRTERTFVNNPYHKGLVSLAMVGGGVFIFMVVLRFLMGGYLTAFNESSAVEEAPLDEGSVFDDNEQTPNEDLAIHQALNQQSDELSDVEKFNQAAKPEVKTPPPPQVTKVSQPPAPAPQPAPVRTVSQTRAVRPAPVNPTPPPRPIVEKPEPKLDPMEQWLLAANMGSYGATNFDAQQVSYNNSYNKALDYPGQSNSGNVVSVSYKGGESSWTTEGIHFWEAQETNQLYANANNTYDPISPNQFMRGTSVKAEVELPIIWMLEASDINQQRDYLIRLKQPLVGASGQEIVPEGSLAVVKAQQFYGNTGFIQLEVTSLIVEKEGITREYPVPPDSLIVLNKKGEILEAKAEKANNVDAGALLLSGIARAASISNRPTSTFVSPFGSTSTGERDLVGGFIEGVTNSAVNSLQQSQNARSFAQDPTVFMIDGGTKVSLVVNKTFSLSNETSNY